MPNEPTIAQHLANLKLRDRVVIEWVDAHNLMLDGWVSLDYLNEMPLDCTVRTLGYFIKQAGDFVLIAGDTIIPQEDDLTEEFNSTSAIPLGCIKRVEALGNG